MPRYFTAIRDAVGRDYKPGYDATPFVRYFVSSITRSADFVLARIRGLGEVMIRVRRVIVDASLPPSMIDGLAFAWRYYVLGPKLLETAAQGEVVSPAM